jgi:histone acetyltransferase
VNSWPFQKAVDPKKVPDYYQIIKEPMDLEKVSRKVNEGAYRSKEDFKKDIVKIFDNARVYNQEETIYYKYANQL